MRDHRPPRRRRSRRSRQLPTRIEQVLWYYYATSLVVTCLGQVLHESAHVLACKLFGAPIHDVCYFRFGSPSGYVVYEVPRRYSPMLGIALAPLFANTTLASLTLLGLIGGLDHWGIPPLSDDMLVKWMVLFGCGWLGISLAFHAVPSPDDVALAWEATVEHFPSIGTLLASPVVLIAWVLSRFAGDGIELVYTGTLVGGLLTLYYSVPPVRTLVGTMLRFSVQVLSSL
jgi:hypothetical protein